jgi:hypothetical protein
MLGIAMRLVACALVCATGVSRAWAQTEVTLVPESAGKPSFVRVSNLAEADWAWLEQRTEAELRESFQVFVKESRATGQAVFGSCELRDRGLVFVPRFPLRPGVAYVVELRLREKQLQRDVLVPKPDQPRTTQVAQVFPTAEVLPQNLLKFYVHFTAPMAQGEAYRYIELATADGRKLEKPFLEIAEELWDRSGKRLTLLLDPGRVKRGLVPREEDGPILIAGQDYRLTIKAEWPDADGVPLAKGFVKRFHVAAEDFVQPDPSTWQVAPPRPGTREPLTVTFPESLDHATTVRGLWLSDSEGKAIASTTALDAHETRALLTPQKPWSEGKLHLHVAPIIEDLAGNSVERAFEVDRFDVVETQAPPRKIISVEIRKR